MTERVPATLVPQWKIDTAAIPRKMRLAHFVAPLSYRGRAGLRLRIALDVHRRPWYLWKHNGETVAASCDFETSLSQSGRWANGFHAGAAAGAAEALEKKSQKSCRKTLTRTATHAIMSHGQDDDTHRNEHHEGEYNDQHHRPQAHRRGAAYGELR